MNYLSLLPKESDSENFYEETNYLVFIHFKTQCSIKCKNYATWSKRCEDDYEWQGGDWQRLLTAYFKFLNPKAKHFFSWFTSTYLQIKIKPVLEVFKNIFTLVLMSYHLLKVIPNQMTIW